MAAAFSPIFFSEKSQSCTKELTAPARPACPVCCWLIAPSAVDASLPALENWLRLFDRLDKSSGSTSKRAIGTYQPKSGKPGLTIHQPGKLRKRGNATSEGVRAGANV